MCRWGYCASCERWRYADWNDPPSCPVCSEAPDPLEQLDNGIARLVGRTTLLLELPPGAELPILT